MRNITKISYVFISTLMTGSYILIWNLFIDNFSNIGFWILYGVFWAIIISFLLFPKKNKRTPFRMACRGFFIPVIIIAAISIAYGWYNPDFPNSSGWAWRKPSILDALDVGSFMFIYFSLMTFGTPYILGTLISLKYTNLDIRKSFE